MFLCIELIFVGEEHPRPNTRTSEALCAVVCEVNRESMLHEAVCEAVIRMNVVENFQAHDILRQALWDYAENAAADG